MVRIEDRVKKTLEDKGYKVAKNGWPDLLVEDPEGNSFFMEIKDAGDKIRVPQKRMLQILANLGFTVLIVSKSNELYQEEHKESVLKLYDFKGNTGTIESLPETLFRIQSEIISKALKKYKNDRIKTANYLGITLRQLRYAISKIQE